MGRRGRPRGLLGDIAERPHGGMALADRVWGSEMNRIDIIRIGGGCITADCDCHIHDGKIVEAGTLRPPFHDGCMCYVEWRSIGDNSIATLIVANRIRQREFSLLRRTIGNLMWLDSLTNNEFRVLQEEIVSCFVPRDLSSAH